MTESQLIQDIRAFKHWIRGLRKSCYHAHIRNKNEEARVALNKIASSLYETESQIDATYQKSAAEAYIQNITRPKKRKK